MNNLLLIPIMGFLNRLRGSGWFKGDRVVASILTGASYTIALTCISNPPTSISTYIYSYLTVAIGFWIWSVPAWLPRDNWSGAKPIKDYLEWWALTVVRQLCAIPCFAMLAWLNHNVAIYYCVFPIILGCGICYYLTSPNCLNLKHHTVWAEYMVGALWGISLWLTLVM